MQIDPHHHYDSCGGPRCCRYCSHILNESPEEGAARIEAENHARGLRSASQSEFRTSTNASAQHDALGRALQGYGSVQLDAPPDPYEAGLAKLRAAQGIPDAPDVTDALRAMAAFRDRLREYALTAGLGLPPATNDIYYTKPPDPYAAAITTMEKKALAARSKEKTR